MNAKPNLREAPGDLVVSRVFDAPPELVWRAWSVPEHFMKWWGPSQFTSPAATLDFRVGGKYHAAMRSPDGRVFWTGGVYREIVPFRRIVYTDSFADAEGNIVPASHYGMPDIPIETIVAITLDDLGGKTKLTLRHTGLPMADGAKAGWTESLEKLAESLKSG